jgi:hypothetical protein
MRRPGRLMRLALVGLVAAAGASAIAGPSASANSAPSASANSAPSASAHSAPSASAHSAPSASAHSAPSASALSAPSASSVGPTNTPCGVAGASGTRIAGGCAGDISPGTLVTAGKQLVRGNVGGAVKTVAGGAVNTVAGGAVKTVVGGAAGTIASTATTAIGLAAIGIWVVGGAQGVLHDTAAALGATTSPQLRTTWFSSTYWRMAAIAAVLTLPFLFAAAVQALIRSDLAMLIRAAFGYLPLAMLAIAIVAPLTMLLLAASDQMCTWISSAAGNAGAGFLTRAGAIVVGLSTLAGSPFLAFLIGLFLIGAAFALWIELLLREAAVYVIVLMLPLAFAALVWPTRRIWAIRAVEVLVALILSKFAIVAVLSLGGAAISASSGHGGIAELMAGAVLILLAAFSPWALLRLVPLAEVAAGAAGPLRNELRPAGASANEAIGLAMKGDDALTRLAGRMRPDDGAGGGDVPAPPRSAPPQSAPPQSAPPQSAPPQSAPPQSAPPQSAPPQSATPQSATPQSAMPQSATPQSGSPSETAPPSDAPTTEDSQEETPAAGGRPFSEQPVFELGGPNFGSTPVYPHPDADTDANAE